jgi:hypothetical protein
LKTTPQVQQSFQNKSFLTRRQKTHQQNHKVGTAKPLTQETNLKKNQALKAPNSNATPQEAALTTTKHHLSSNA